MSRLSLILAAAAFAATGAMAAEPPALTSASAKRVAEGHVELKVSWQGGACEKPGKAVVDATEADEVTDAVTIPTVATSEICTMQIVTVEFSGLVPVEPFTTTLAISVLAPNGQIQAGGQVTIE
ncbi:MAG TPA: hypothetical protein PK286_10890 [Devosia sp.]|nr:hypothetical protein [Devosia sp.]